MDPLISVILAVYNQEKYVAETIESILAQTFQEFELLILDDGSTDNSAQIIREFATKDTRIRAFFETNAGRSTATNYLVNQAKGEWCAILDADDLMLPHRLEKQLAFHQANPGIHASSSDCYYINEKGNMFGTQHYEGFTTVTDFEQNRGKKEFITCSYTGMMVSRDVFIKIGGLTKNFELCDDFEFFNRLVDYGFVLLVIPEVLVKYRIHSSAITVRKPLLMLDKLNYVIHCIKLRRSGQPEISFEEFIAIQQNESFWTKFNRRRFQYSMILFRTAGTSMLSKKYISFIWQIATSAVLSPNYVLNKVVNYRKK